MSHPPFKINTSVVRMATIIVRITKACMALTPGLPALSKSPPTGTPLGKSESIFPKPGIDRDKYFINMNQESRIMNHGF